MPQGIRLEPIYESAGSRVENVLHYSFSSTVTEEAIQEFLGEWKTVWETNLAPLISQSVNLIQIVGTDISSDTGPQVVFTDDLPQPGTALESTTLPNNVTVTTKLLTTKRGRSYRGRVYHIGLVEGAVIGDSIGSTTRSALNAAWSALRLFDMTAGVWVLSVLSRTQGNILTPVVSVGGDLVVDSQRRRLLGRGR